MTENEQRRFEILLEQVLHEVRIVAEGHSALDAKIERFHKEAKENHQLAMNLIKYSYDSLHKEIQGVRTELKEKIQGVRTELKETKEELKNEMAAGFKDLGDKLAGHEARISALEQKVA